MILYTYDSFLFDISPNDGKGLIKEIQKILEYPTSVHIGKNYGKYDELYWVVVYLYNIII